MDAIHLALASTAKADFSCTCDDKWLRKAQALADLGCEVTTLLGLVPEISVKSIIAGIKAQRNPGA